jgi:hypothetical protein
MVFASGTFVRQPEPEKPHERQTVVDQELGPVVREVVLRLDDEDLKHEDRLHGGRPPFVPSL